MSNRSISWRERARAASLYLGLFPIAFFMSKKDTDSFFRHHARQTGALFSVFLLLTALLATMAVSLSYMLVFHRGTYEGLHLERYSLGFLRKLYLAWFVFWAFGFGLALVGSDRPMPFVRRLMKKAFLWRSACGVALLLYAVLLSLVPVAFHARALAPIDRSHGPVQFLYEDNDIFPRWFFLLAFYPMIQRATHLWGPESVVVQRFDRESAMHAVAEADVLYIGSHGTAKGLMLKDGWLVPGDLEGVPISPSLRFVYLSGCDSGQQRNGWLDAFAPAEVVTYDRLSAVLEHAWWLWFTGPKKLSSVYEERQS